MEKVLKLLNYVVRKTPQLLYLLLNLNSVIPFVYQ